MEKIMRKTDHTSTFGHGTFEDRTLDDKKLDAVTGGWPFWPSPPKDPNASLRQWVYGSPGHIPHG
jgi:hypothetical protein